MKIFLKSLFNFLILLVVIVIVFTLYGYYEVNIKGKSFVNYFGYSFFEVMSGSMSPNIEVYDLVVVKLGDNSYKKGDIITYKVGNDFVTHRVFDMEYNGVITKGDSNNDVDGVISNSDILGKVVYVVPSFGIWKKVVFDKRVMGSIFITICLFSFYFLIGNREKEVMECEKEVN